MRRAREIRPGLRGLAMSGWGQDGYMEKSLEVGFAEHLTKPVDVQTRAKAIGRVIGK